jgi:hypothetical protein
MVNRSRGLVLVGVLCAMAALAYGSDPVVFPKLTADNLQKATMHLPDDFKGKKNLLVVTFEREQQKEADSWLPVAKQLTQDKPDFSYYELPVLPRRDILYRWWLNSAMRSAMPDQAGWAHTVPLYTDKESFREKLQIPTEQTISLLLVDKEGTVLWRTTGPLNDDKKKALMDALGSH